MGELFNRTQQGLIKRRDNLLNGNVNSIPSPFQRFRNDFVGLEQESYLLISSFSKGGKSQFTLYLLFEALMYILDYPDAADMKVFYFALEETDERILQRFESYLLYKLDKKRISPKNLRSTYNDNPISQEILDLLNSERYQVYIRAFEEKFVFSNVANPTGIRIICENYAKDNGTIHYKTIKIKDEFGQWEDKKVFDYYTPNNPQEFRFVVVDHCSLVRPERGMSIKETIDQLSKNCVDLRNRYRFSPIIIQQQSAENESNDSMKMKNIRPSGRGLSDSKYTLRDSNTFLGLFSPFKFSLESYAGYDIKAFKDHIRFIEVVVSRDGEVGGMTALFFDGACNMFWELPKPDDPAINKWYEYVEQLKD